MPLWVLFLLSFFLLAFACIGAVWYFLTAILGTVISASAYPMAAGIAGSLVVLVLLLVGVLFIVLSRSITGPLKRLSKAVEEFSATGVAPAVDISKGAPREMRGLVTSFTTMMERVDAAHARDVEVSRVKSDFISTAAHQLRTPLTGIRWALEALQTSSPTAEQTELIDSAVAKSKELVAIVGTLLDISAIESGKYKYQFAPTDVSGLLAEIATDFSPLAQKRNVTLLHVSDGGTLPPIRADRERVKWILNNLIENALRYTPAGGNVRMTAEAVGSSVIIHVRDTGIGILPKDRENIFERFFRAQNAISKENEGNGLGLYIARTIAKDHGGDLEFRANEDGPGTTFTLSLPLAAA